MIGFLCLLLTVGIYGVAKRMYRNLPKYICLRCSLHRFLSLAYYLQPERIMPRIAVAANG